MFNECFVYSRMKSRDREKADGVTDPRTVECAPLRELMRINAPSTDFRFKYNTIPRALLTISYVSYIRECMRVNKIFLDGKKGRDLWIKRKHARDFAFTMSRENIAIRRWDLMEKYAGIMAFMSIGTYGISHMVLISTSIFDSQRTYIFRILARS